jgi:hypothetical protein
MQLTLLLLAANIFVASRVYLLWTEGPWQLPAATEIKTPITVASLNRQEAPKEKPDGTPISTKNIVEKNLFDPDRGQGQVRADKEAEANAIAMQRLRSMVLVGTIILGSSRYAMLEDFATSGAPGPRPQPQSQQQGQIRRVKLGDTVEGFKLSDIEDRRVVFAKGASKIEIALDYFRKVTDGRPPAVASSSRPQSTESQGPAQPLQPRFPRRDARRS